MITAVCRLGGKKGILEMSEKKQKNIDEPSDWAIIKVCKQEN
jgi:CMP-N-acetylneuraminic acid synthetase